jgi:putative restriction endonuclease
LRSPNWTREQTLACFNLYCRIPFGRFDQGTPEVIAFASAINRTPSAVAMKLSNFASFDPAHQARKVKGLSNASNLDRDIWNEFETAPNHIAEQSEEAFNQLSLPHGTPTSKEPELPSGPTEAVMSRPMRLVQSFFRRSVLASYEYKCCFCGLDVRPLLNASHIIPWSISVELRSDPRNGLCLCALHDRAFDRELVSIDRDCTLLISRKLKKTNPAPLHQVGFLALEGQKVLLPGRFLPSEHCIEHHRNRFLDRNK